MTVLGLDIGSSSCKVAAYDDEGNVVATRQRGYPTLSPELGFAELDPDEVIQNCFEVIREAARACAEPPQAIGITSQGEAFTALDEDGRCLCPAMTSSDVRASALVASEFTPQDRRDLYDRTGHTLSFMYSLPKLLWLRENRSDVWRKAHQFLCFEDLMTARLGLNPTMAHSLAARTMLFNVTRRQWDGDLLARVGIQPEQMASTVSGGTIVGRLSDSIAATLGLSRHCAVIVNGHDQPCAANGVGASVEGTAHYSLGTVYCVCPTFAEATFTDELYRSGLATYPASREGQWTTVAFSLAGSNVVNWCRDLLYETGSPESRTQRMLCEMDPDRAAGLVALPYLTATGTPDFDTVTPGVITGLRAHHTSRHISAAFLKGAAFEIRWNLEILARSGIRVERLIASGGGAQSPELVQLHADCLGVPIQPSGISQAGCRGAASNARVAVVGSELPVSAVTATLVEPRARYQSQLADDYALFHHLRHLASQVQQP